MFQRLTLVLLCLCLGHSAYADKKKPGLIELLDKLGEQPPSGSIQEDKKWICIADLATGFAYENGQWRRANFNTDNNRYIVSRSKEVSNKYQVIKIGEKYATICDSDKPNTGGYLHCNEINIFKINIQKLRYMRIYPFGFVDGFDNSDNTPVIEIGKCSQF